MESVFHTSFYVEDCEVKFDTCMIMDAIMTWWNDHSKTMSVDLAYALA